MAKYGTKDYVEDLLTQPPSYAESADTLAAKDKMTEYEGKITTEPFEGTYTQQVYDMVKSYLGKDRFNYNPNNDSTYQQLRDTYLQGGKNAMQDTLGNGAILSGGNNNSSAQVAAQQVYNNYAKSVADTIPTLEEQAYNRYRTENADMLQDISLLGSLDDKEYSRHQDEVNNIINLLNYYGGKYQNSVANDQTIYGNDLNIWGQQTSAGQSEYQNTRSEVMNLLLSGIDVEDSISESVGITKDMKSNMLEMAKKSASVSTGGGSGDSSYTSTQIKQMFKDGDYDSLMTALISMDGDIYENASKYGISRHEIDFINNKGKKITSQKQLEYLLNNYKKKGTPDTVSAWNAMTESEFYAYGNHYSAADTYADYLTVAFLKYIDWEI